MMIALMWTHRAAAAEDPQPIALVVKAGRPLHVALDERITVRRVGQPITGTVVEPVYVYDRLVVPAGAKVRGHVRQLADPRKAARIYAMLGGDFSPHRQIVLEFDTLALADGRELPIQTVVGRGVANVKRRVAGASAATKKTGRVERARAEAERRARDAIAEARQRATDALDAMKQPGKMARLKQMAIQRLPYHPQFLNKGTVYAAVLSSPVPFGDGTPVDRAPAGTLPAPESILNARLATALDSGRTPRGTLIEAVVTEPVFSSDHQLILPEGTTLGGEVTFSREARRFHRNGQLRFLFESVQVGDEDRAKLLAALYSVQTGAGDRVAVDDEGGTSVTNSNTRFIAPALAILALRASTDRDERRLDNDADDVEASSAAETGSIGSGSLGGFLGFGLIGTALTHFSHPVGVAIAAVGVARTMYSNVLAKGKNVAFPVDTAIQLQLAPGPTPAK